MNRTKEFMNIVKSTNFPQKEHKIASTTYTDLFIEITSIKKVIDEVDKIVENERLYESFTINKKLEKAKESLIGLRKKCNFNPEYSNEQERDCYQNILNIILNRINEQSLRINSIIRKKNERTVKIGQRRQTFSHENDIGQNSDQMSTNLMITEEEEQVGKYLDNNETVKIRNRERERITNQINEIGHIMEEIGLHVSLQEESLKRIDDLMNESNKIIDNSLYMLKDVLSRSVKSRATILKFFAFLVYFVLCILVTSWMSLLYI